MNWREKQFLRDSIDPLPSFHELSAAVEAGEEVEIDSRDLAAMLFLAERLEGHRRWNIDIITGIAKIRSEKMKLCNRCKIYRPDSEYWCKSCAKISGKKRQRVRTREYKTSDELRQPPCHESIRIFLYQWNGASKMEQQV